MIRSGYHFLLSLGAITTGLSSAELLPEFEEKEAEKSLVHQPLW
jgi:hypothetical protein